MTAYSVHRADACPLTDDVDAVRTLYGGNCSEPIWCYEKKSLAGTARIAVAIVLSFVVSWIVVTLRVLCVRAGGRAVTARGEVSDRHIPVVAGSVVQSEMEVPTNNRSGVRV